MFAFASALIGGDSLQRGRKFDGPIENYIRSCAGKVLALSRFGNNYGQAWRPRFDALAVIEDQLQIVACVADIHRSRWFQRCHCAKQRSRVRFANLSGIHHVAK